jgi:hypothetical protein
MDWLQIFVNLVLTGILLYVFQRVIDERSARRLEEFKTDLKSTAFERETKFSKLHEKRVGVLAELYTKLSFVRRPLDVAKLLVESQASGVVYGEKLPDLINKFSAAIDEFVSFYKGVRLYLPSHLCAQIDLYHRYSMDTWQSLTLRYAVDENLIKTKDNPSYSHNLLSEFYSLSEKLDSLSMAIEKEFRGLIGSM